MTKYKFVGDGSRYFPDISARLEPGDIVESDDELSETWFTQVSDKRKPTVEVTTSTEE